MPKIAIFARWSWTRLWGAVATHRAGLQRETFFSRQSNTYILIWYEDVFCFSSYGIQFQGVALSLPWTKVWQNTEEKWIEYKINAIFELRTLESPCIDFYYGLICPAPWITFIFWVFGVVCQILGKLQHLPVFRMPMSIKSGTVSYQDTCVSHGFLNYTFEQNTNMLLAEVRLSGGLSELF